MDEQEIMQTETAESEVEVEETEVQDTTDAWDDDWGDLEDEEFTEDDDDDEGMYEEGHLKQDSVTDKESDTDSKEEVEPTEDKTEGEEAKAKLFHLKHLNEEIDVDEAEVIKLAQKGMDYDFIRGERDSLKAEVAKYREYDAFLNELAANSEQTVDELIDSTRTRLLVANEKKEGRTMGEAEAMQRVQRERANRQKPAEEPANQDAVQDAEPSAETQWQARQKQIVQDFVKSFPTLDPKTIPQEIFMKGLENGNLIEETMKWLDSERDKELEKLRSENEKLKQNQKNKARSTGSRQSVGKAKSHDPIDDDWYDGT